MVLISTSILGIKDKLEKNIKKVIYSKTDYIHIDIMDGKFVPNKTFDFEALDNALNTNKKLDIHLMVQNTLEYINEYKKLNPEFITIHYENKPFDDAIKLIKKNNIKVGLAVKPNTEITEIYNVLDKIDLVLIMSVEPGFGGQKFINSSLDKIKKFKKYIVDNNYNTLISVDGGINDETAKLAIDAGCDMLVCGSFITNSNDYDIQINKILN